MHIIVYDLACNGPSSCGPDVRRCKGHLVTEKVGELEPTAFSDPSRDRDLWVGDDGEDSKDC